MDTGHPNKFPTSRGGSGDGLLSFTVQGEQGFHYKTRRASRAANDQHRAAGSSTYYCTGGSLGLQ